MPMSKSKNDFSSLFTILPVVFLIIGAAVVLLAGKMIWGDAAMSLPVQPSGSVSGSEDPSSGPGARDPSQPQGAEPSSEDPSEDLTEPSGDFTGPDPSAEDPAASSGAQEPGTEEPSSEDPSQPGTDPGPQPPAPTDPAGPVPVFSDEVTEDNLGEYLDFLLNVYGSNPESICVYVYCSYRFRHLPLADQTSMVLEMINTGAGSCYYYAALTAALLERAGYPCRIVYGYSQASMNEAHAWVLYRTASGWVHADTTPWVRYNGPAVNFSDTELHLGRGYFWDCRLWTSETASGTDGVNPQEVQEFLDYVDAVNAGLIEPSEEVTEEWSEDASGDETADSSEYSGENSPESTTAESSESSAEGGAENTAVESSENSGEDGDPTQPEGRDAPGETP